MESNNLLEAFQSTLGVHLPSIIEVATLVGGEMIALSFSLGCS